MTTSHFSQAPSTRIYEVPLKDIDVDEVNVRHHEPEKDLEELAESIKRHGQLQPVVLRGEYGNPRYNLVIGQRRYLAVRDILRKPTILGVFAGKITDEEAKIRSLVENMVRSELSYGDTADAITSLYKHFRRDDRKDAFGRNAAFKVIGEPVDTAGAADLAKADPYQFQWWALGLVGARPAEGKRGADEGIDGRIFFHDEAAATKTKQVVLQVKAGRVNLAHVRDLRGALDREKAEIGVLISLEEPTKPMRREAADTGFYHSPGYHKDYPRLQVLTIAELLAGGGIDMPPPRQTNVTFKKAPKAKTKKAANPDFLE
jgi:hypothetical protein